MPATWDPLTLRDALQSALDGGAPLVLGGPVDRVVPEGVALVLRTSGSSTGVGRPVALSAAALLASTDATHARLSGPGRWVLALPPVHVAGVQVLVRSVRAGLAPVLVRPGPFDATALADAVLAAPDDAPLYLSLVPTQLHRVLEADDRALAALARCSAVLLGGAAAARADVDRARAAGVPVVTTYGMTETSGGCVYDGLPLPGAQVRIRQGRVLLGGPMLAEGYLDDGPQPFEHDAEGRWFVTSDAGAVDAEGRLAILGRVDDVIITGGVKVHPTHVERLLEPLVGEVIVVGVPDAEWGAIVTAVVTRACSLTEVRDAVGHGPDAPRAVVVVDELPTRGPGKPDRRAALALAQAAQRR
ncbi:AMP-binding protein [Pseudactinotalea terrae]|uniref:AMP-binding protein n=1 Tax=Pseudactinotalea terrae TaxID=1743262 RepID=UPI00147874BF|nr:AMP-binding protein [Pseudactinotalea terrae]